MRDSAELIFKSLGGGDATSTVTPSQIVSIFAVRGISIRDPRLAHAAKLLKRKGRNEPIAKEEFCRIFEVEQVFLARIMHNDLVIPEFNSFENIIENIFEKVAENKSGEVATYIPQLARVDPDMFGVALCTVDGQVLRLGDEGEMFCVQSGCKPLNYCLALEEHGLEKVHKHVGHEPSGASFNELTLNKMGLPHNPMINSGAIMSCSLIKPQLAIADRFDHVLSTWRRMCHSRKVGFNNSVYLSERDTADRNYALAYFMRENKAFPENTDLKQTLEFYFQCCSIETTARDLATFAATMANGGICPFSHDKVFEPSTIKSCLSLMNSCGMYDYSGAFSFHIGLPAKSGVSGVVFVVVPNTLGLCIWSPRLDRLGNSVRGIEFCKELTRRFLFHNYDNLALSHEGKINPRIGKEHESMHWVQAPLNSPPDVQVQT